MWFGDSPTPVFELVLSMENRAAVFGLRNPR